VHEAANGLVIGSRLWASAPDIVVPPILAFILAASAMKLLNFSNTELLIGLIVLALALTPAWGLIAQTERAPHRHCSDVRPRPGRLARPDRSASCALLVFGGDV